MTAARPTVTAITAGTRLIYYGEARTVADIEAGRLMLKGARGKSLLADTAAVLADTAAVLPGTGEEPTTCRPLLDRQDFADLGRRLEQIPEVAFTYTGLRPEEASRIRDQFATWPRDARQIGVSPLQRERADVARVIARRGREHEADRDGPEIGR